MGRSRTEAGQNGEEPSMVTTLVFKKRATMATALLSAALVLLSALVTVYLSPTFGLLEIGVLVGGLVAVYFARSLRKFVFLMLITKPLIDLTWRWRFATVAEQGINVQTLVAVLVIVATALALFFWRKRLVIDVKVFLLLAFAAFSVLLTPTSWGINELVRLFAGVAFFFTTGIVLKEGRSFDTFAKYFILAVSVPVFLAFLQRAQILPYEYWDWIGRQRVGRISGTYQHPLGLIYFLVCAIPLALYLLENPSRRLWQRLLLWLFIGLSLVAAALAYHRTGLAALGLSIWLWMVLSRKYGRAILLIVLAGLLAFWLQDWLQLLYANVVEMLEGKVTFSSRTFLRGRGTNWYLFLHSLFRSHPLFWIFGRGGSIAKGFVPNFGYVISNEPHNDFIRILHAYGLVGLGLYIAILFSFFRKSLYLRRTTDLFSRRLGNVMIIVLMMILLLSITGEPMRYPTAVWYLFALGSVVWMQYRRLRHVHDAGR
jgi:hypothetical protein